MPVPTPLILLATAINLHEPHAPLDKPPRDQALPGEMLALRILEPIKPLHHWRFLLDIKRLGRRHLHPIGQLERLDPRRQIAFARMLLEAAAIEPREQVELRSLLGIGHLRAAIEILNRRSL